MATLAKAREAAQIPGLCRVVRCFIPSTRINLPEWSKIWEFYQLLTFLSNCITKNS
jgi:hypothetical protein